MKSNNTNLIKVLNLIKDDCTKREICCYSQQEIADKCHIVHRYTQEILSELSKRGNIKTINKIGRIGTKINNYNNYLYVGEIDKVQPPNSGDWSSTIKEAEIHLAESNKVRFGKFKFSNKNKNLPLEPIELPPFFKDIDDRVMKIIGSRVSYSDAIKYNFKYCFKAVGEEFKYFSNRLIMPIYFENKLVYYIGRTFDPTVDPKFKYYNPKSSTDRIVWGWDDVQQYDSVILCEGIFSAIAVRNFDYPNSIAILGKDNISAKKINMIRSKFKLAHICFDNDIPKNGKNAGQEGAKKLGDILKNSGIEVYNVLLPSGKDPDLCSKMEFDSSFNNKILMGG